MAASSSAVLKPPPNAVVWGLVRVMKRGDRGRGKCVGEPLEDGTVPDRWAVSEFSTARVLEMFGPDHYRVDWYASDGMRISGRSFTVAHPPARGAKLQQRATQRARGQESDGPAEDRERGAAAPSGDGFSFREFFAMQEQARRDEQIREERNDERRRAEAAAQQARDREFMATVLGAMIQTRSQPEASSDLMRRELSLEIRSQMHALRQDLGERLGELEEQQTPEPGAPPADLEEGFSRVGGALLGELEQQAPHLINELIPAVADFLKRKGFTPSPEVAAQMAATVERRRNGAGQS